MKKLIEDNYKSIVDRGLITPSTTRYDFYTKLIEEVDELYNFSSEENFREELADVILVCFNWAEHEGIDIEKELQKKIDKNFQRAEN